MSDGRSRNPRARPARRLPLRCARTPGGSAQRRSAKRRCPAAGGLPAPGRGLGDRGPAGPTYRARPILGRPGGRRLRPSTGRLWSSGLCEIVAPRGAGNAEQASAPFCRPGKAGRGVPSPGRRIRTAGVRRSAGGSVPSGRRHRRRGTGRFGRRWPRGGRRTPRAAARAGRPSTERRRRRRPWRPATRCRSGDQPRGTGDARPALRGRRRAVAGTRRARPSTARGSTAAAPSRPPA